MKSRTSKRNKFLALGAAGVVAVGGAGLYAGVLATTTTGLVGAGTVALQASCASAATITPGAATWDTTTDQYMYTAVTVDYTAGAATCEGQKATVNVHLTSDGSIVSTNATPHTVSAGEATATAFSVTLDTKVPANIDASLNGYGLVIQTA